MWTAAGLAVAAMIGTGIFTVTGFMAADVPSPWWILGLWVAGGLVALMGALSIAELGAMLPRAGGEYVYMHTAYGPLWGFLTGWVGFFVGFSAPIALTAVGFMEYVGAFVPALSPAEPARLDLGFFALQYSWGHLGAVLTIAAFAALSYTGMRATATVQNGITAVKVVLLAALLVAGLLWGAGSWGHLADYPAVPPVRTLLPGAGVSLIFVMYSYSGWNAASYIAGEMRDPERNIPRALVVGTLGVMALYIGFNLLYLYALPIAEMQGVLAIGADSFRALFGAGAGSVYTGILTISILASVGAMTLLGPRMSYAMARNGLFFRTFATLHPRYRTPARASVLQAACAAAFVFTGTFDQLLTYAGFSMQLIMAMTVAGVAVLRWKRPDLPRPYRAWGYPVTPLLFSLCSLWMVGYTLVDRPEESRLGLLTIAAALPVYYLFRRGRAGEAS